MQSENGLDECSFMNELVEWNQRINWTNGLMNALGMESGEFIG